MNIKSDGIFTIQKGQGISQGIANEIGLSEEQLKKLDKSIWDAVMNEVAQQREIDPELYAGGNDVNGSTNKNFVVKEGQTITITLKGAWNKILNIINNALGTNFESEETKEIQENNTTKEPTQTTITISKEQAEKLANLKAQLIQEQKEFTKTIPHNTSWTDEQKKEFNNISKKFFKALEEFKKPEVEGEQVTIVDSDGNVLVRLKAIKSSEDGNLRWLAG